MYSETENGSKAALIGLAQILEDNGFVMIDCQFHTDHLERMGEIKISYIESSLEIQKDEEHGLKVIGEIYRIEDGTVDFEI